MSDPQPAQRSWLEVRWRQFKNPPQPVFRAVAVNLAVAIVGGMLLLVSALVAPANTPKDTVSQFTSWFTAALHVPELKPKFAALGLLPVGICGADFGAYLHKQYQEYGRLIRELNIKGG